jgi:hypothetical protein
MSVHEVVQFERFLLALSFTFGAVMIAAWRTRTMPWSLRAWHWGAMALAYWNRALNPEAMVWTALVLTNLLLVNLAIILAMLLQIEDRPGDSTDGNTWRREAAAARREVMAVDREERAVDRETRAVKRDARMSRQDP